MTKKKAKMSKCTSCGGTINCMSVSKLCLDCSDKKAADAIARLREAQLYLDVPSGDDCKSTTFPCPVCGEPYKTETRMCTDCFEKVLGHNDGLEHVTNTQNEAAAEYRKKHQKAHTIKRREYRAKKAAEKAKAAGPKVESSNQRRLRERRERVEDGRKACDFRNDQREAM